MTTPHYTRRHFLSQQAFGLGGLALSWLLQQDSSIVPIPGTKRVHYLDENAQLAKLTPVPPVHRMAKAVAIVPVGHDFPPFSANKGGNAEGTKLFLLTFDLAFELQEQIRAIDSVHYLTDRSRESQMPTDDNSS